MTEQDTLALEATCKCGARIPYQGVGRPRSTCDDCRPPTWPPLASERLHKVPSALSRKSDPETSREAAASIDDAALTARVLEAFEQFGLLNCDELVAVLDDPLLNPPTVKSLVSRLGKSSPPSLRKTAMFRPSRCGRRSVCWERA